MRLELQSQSVSDFVARMEDARASGTLGSVLEQIGDETSSGQTSQLAALYRRFDGQPFIKPVFRAEHVEAVVREAMWPLRQPKIVFPASLHKCQRVKRDNGDLRDDWEIVPLESVEVVLRQDQAVSASYWGIGFELDSDEDNRLLEEHLLGACINQLVHMLRDLELVEQQFRRRRYENAHILPPRDSADFEQLLIDILNEYGCEARHARLGEDLLEKTDLRVYVKNAKRRKGAWVQITTTIDPLFYQSKLAQIDRLEEIVMLSPASIARFVNETGKEWQTSILHNSGTLLLKEKAEEIRSSLFTALDHRHISPLGPFVAVPENLRNVIRDFIRVEATRSTEALREREVADGKVRPSMRLARQIVKRSSKS